MKVTEKMDKIDIQYVIKRKGLTQKFIAEHFEVTEGAITQAFDNVTCVRSLRKKIINYINNYNN